jgi:hypothetical protein
MSTVERQFERVHQVFLNIARAMFIDRLHVLRLTEIVRAQIRPNDEGVMLLPTDLDEEMKKQAFDFVMAMMPEEFHVELLTQRKAWLTPQ